MIQKMSRTFGKAIFAALFIASTACLVVVYLPSSGAAAAAAAATPSSSSSSSSPSPSSASSRNPFGGDSNPGTCTCQLEGQIEDCCCGFADIDTLNRQIEPLTARLAQSSFFRFYRVDMDRKCRFWDDEEGKCGKTACSVEACADEEVPSTVKQLEGAHGEKTPFKCTLDERLATGEHLGALTDTITVAQQQQFANWRAFDERSTQGFCDVGDEDPAGAAKFVNLIDNPERFTGYSGKSAARIWRAIYTENCFKPEQEVKYLTTSVVNDMCLEKRVFHRIVSGLHATINIHVAASYPRPQHGGGGGGAAAASTVEFSTPDFLAAPPTELSWGPNITMFRRFFSPARTFGEGPSWLKNVYFTHALLVRAILKGAPMWDPRHFHTGNAEEDEEVNAVVQQLLATAKRLCPASFDETAMFAAAAAASIGGIDGNNNNDNNSNNESSSYSSSASAAAAAAVVLGSGSGSGSSLRDEFRSHFRNITRIMDCVGCNTCRLWGKLKVHGLGAAMRILFAEQGRVNLRRNEVVALFNTLNQFAHSIAEIQMFRDMEEAEAEAEAKEGEGSKRERRMT